MARDRRAGGLFNAQPVKTGALLAQLDRQLVARLNDGPIIGRHREHIRLSIQAAEALFPYERRLHGAREKACPPTELYPPVRRVPPFNDSLLRTRSKTSA